MEQIFDPAYVFALQPGSVNLPFWRVMLGVAAGQVVLMIISIVFARKFKLDALASKPWRRIAVWSGTSAVIIGLLAFFRFQDAYFLSMRAFIFAWILGATLWLGSIFKYWLLDIPEKKKHREERRAFEQYLPQKKA